MQPEPAPIADAKLAAEQAAIDHAYTCLTAMRERTERVLAQARADAKLTDALDAAAIQHALLERLAAVADSKAPLTFGRIQEESMHGRPGETHYIGRRHVENETGDAVVVDWRAPVAAPFYRATWADPQGLDVRSRFALDGRTLVGTFDEDFSDPEGEGGGSGGVPDPLLAELDRARTGSMRDIVATIQAEQDRIIRAPINELIVVQGGPGTGKTAVGLHRAAYLLYAHRAEFERRKLLVVGPNKLFLSYISQVLPSLGETAVIQTTVESMLSRTYPIRSTEAANVVALKGSPRMITVLHRAIYGRIARGEEVAGLGDLDVMTAFGGAHVDSADVASLVEEICGRVLPTNVGREAFRDQLAALAWKVRSRRSDVSPEQQFVFTRDLLTQSGFRSYVEKIWPSLSAPAVVRSLLGNKALLARLSSDVFDSSERAALYRAAAKKLTDERWARGDLGLLDEVNHCVTGETPMFGHVVVDEAQDLTAMELRMVARRSPSRSITVLGDLAQSTGIGGSTSWVEALTQLGHGRFDGFGIERATVEGKVDELELGYRVPAVLISYANQLLPIAAPSVRPSRSVREGGTPPEIVSVDSSTNSISEAAIARAEQLLIDFPVVGLLAPPSLLEELASTLRASRINYRDARTSLELEDGVTLIAAELAKGLEFDAIVVVEPSQIVREVSSSGSRGVSGDTEAAHNADVSAGYRVLYVALTRATQRVVVIHADELPAPLLERAPAQTVPAF